MWAYNRAYDPTGKYTDPASPLPYPYESAKLQWGYRRRMEQRFTFTGKNAVTRFLNEYGRDSGQFALLPGDPIYFLSPRAGIEGEHAVMYVGEGYIIHASGSDGKVVCERLQDALSRYTGGGDWFRLVGLGRIKAGR